MNTLIDQSRFLQSSLDRVSLADSPWAALALFGLAAIILIVTGIRN